MKKTTTIQRRILHRVIPAVVGMLLILTAVNTWQQNDEQKKNMEKYQEELAERISTEVSSKISNLTTDLKWSASQNEIQSMDPEIYDKTLAKYYDSNKQDFALLFVIYPDGRYYVAGKGFQKATLTDRKYFGEVMHERKEFAMTSPDVSKSTGEMKYTLAVPIKGETGQVVGILAANIKLSTLSNIITSLKSNENMINLICDEKANIIASKKSEEIMKVNIAEPSQTQFIDIDQIGKAIKGQKKI